MMMDVGRAGAALAAPGMDPREWIAIGVVVDTPTAEADQGYFVRVLIPMTLMEVTVTAAVCQGYAGGGFGAHAPLRPDDKVVVANPGGTPDAGYYVVGRYWDRSDPPPQDVVDHPTDVHLVVESDRSARVAVSGAGSVVVEARGTGRIDLTAPEVRVGAAPVQRMILGEAYRSAEDAMLSSMQSMASALSALATGLGAASAGLGPYPNPALVPLAAAAASAASAAASAVAAFEAGAANYLALHGKVS